MRDRPSPNHGPRRDGAGVELIVLHYTAMSDADGAIRWLCDPAREVSAHYVLAEDGTATRLVPEDRRAWHAGAGEWGGRGDVNSRSIGIEIANDGASPFPEAQMTALETLVGGLIAQHDLPPAAVIGHSDLAPGRKIDPGARFDWRRMARCGLAVWPETSAGLDAAPAPDADAFDRDARAFGYTAPVDHPTRLSAFRLRFRPWARGPVQAGDMAAIADLVSRWPAAPARVSDAGRRPRT